MILQNAHDGSRAYRIDAGLYRLVCRNGLTVADADFAHVSPSGTSMFPPMRLRRRRSPWPRIRRARWRWSRSGRPCSCRRQPGSSSRRAAALRWDADQPVMKLLKAQKLLTPVRYSDAATDLWTTFNTVQEHLIRGGDRYMGYTEGMGIRRNRTRGVTGEGQKLNKALWSLATEFSVN